MKTLKSLIKEIAAEIIQFNNWKIPSEEKLKQEYKIEHDLKENDFFDSIDDFLIAVKKGKIIKITRKDDKLINYRSRTRNKDDLLSLISTYRSWKQGYRTKETFNAIYDGFMNNLPMELPIVIEFADGNRRVFSGNTRLDAAFHLGIEPKVLLVKSGKDYY